MARTKQTARAFNSRSLAPQNNDEVPDEEDQVEINAQLTEEEKQKRAELEKMPMQPELKHLEKRWTKKGRAYIAEPKEDEDLPEEAINWYQKFALCITRTYDSRNKVIQRTQLQVNSPALKEMLAEVIGNYPGQSYLTSDITVDFPPRSLYHYRDEIAAELPKHDPASDPARHISILTDFIAQEFEETIKEGDNLRRQGLMSYPFLWTLFKPGSLVFAKRLGQPRVYKLKSCHYACGNCPGLALAVEYVDYDGDDFGTREQELRIPAFAGAAPIADLAVLPLGFHDGPARVTEALVARGRRWEALAGQNFREYKGVALDSRLSRYNIEGRVMIDTATHHRLEPDHAFGVNPIRAAAGSKRRRGEEDGGGDDETEPEGREGGGEGGGEGEWQEARVALTDEQCLLASPMVRGFSFTEKRFLDFFVDRVAPVEWNTACFDQLVLPDSQKELVQALVAEHTLRTTRGGGSSGSSGGFDDIVKGKGRGLVLVLHGPPGVGKTLTAECVAEFARRPLYIVSSGDLGTSAAELDARLGRTLDLAGTWKAVLLIDEADVFLERRSLHDMERNSLVSIFLRTLEYYAGILFMTTNRVRTFDDAFKSRIHVPLRYDDLPRPSRVRIWKNFLGRLGPDAVDIDEDGYADLAEGRLNGRQIKNVVRTAKSLAAYKKRKLDHAQLKQVMDIQMAFEMDLQGAEGDIDMVER